ncbi:hypothetical protein N5079_30075 [Planotetraspora sp. A-T 1434]|uniref:hypothetical protein n=1 Tax=Planotetraspora sp. A-T 1434 TaxID=2979219 RepID=UPI0021BE1C66|nr:hypothetical protein [Planotetraspora sp. A-T 1434]MCT9934461.1 hypothetical protein [Planotetraspora sp. A-T 1434]
MTTQAVSVDVAGPADEPAVPDECRDWLRRVADLLIPASETMPAASDAGVAARQLDVVLRSRPDLTHHLLRAWTLTVDTDPPEVMAELRALDPTAHDALCLIVAGGYYTNPRVRGLLGYTGQQPHVVGIAEDIDEELLSRVIERGPRYREA